MLSTIRTTRRFTVSAILSVLAACGGGGGGGSPPPPPPPPVTTYTVSAAVTGLAGSGLTLLDNGGDSKAVTANGSVTFATALASAAPYAVTVGTQPTTPSQTCTVTNGSGSIAAANISNVAVNCATKTFAVGGTVSGLTGSGLLLANNGADGLTVTGSAFTFATAVASGTAYAVTVATQPTNPAQNCTVNSGTGTVTTANISNIVVTCAVSKFTIGGGVSGLAGTGLQVQNNVGDTLSVTQNGSFTFATSINSGANYSISVSTNPVNPIQLCTLTNGTGTVGNANVTNATLDCKTQNPRVALSLNYYGGSSNVYLTDAASGQLRLRSVIKAENTPITFYGDKAGKFLFFLNQGTAQSPFASPPIPQTSSSLSAFIFDPPAGDAREVAGSPYPTSSGLPAATGLSALPGDGFIYVTNSSLNNIEGFAVSATGTLTSVGSPFPTGAGPNPVTFDNAGHFGYVSNQTSASVFVYSVNGTTGALTEIQADRVVTGLSPTAVSLTADGKFAYVLNSSSTSAFSVNSSSGALTAIAGSPFPVPVVPGGGNNPLQTLIFNPNGKSLYVKNDGGTGTGSLAAFSIDSATGALSPLSGSPLPLGVSATGLAGLDPAGRFLYVANQGTCTVANGGCNPSTSSTGSISAFSLDAVGVPTALAGLPAITPPPYQLSVDPSGRFLYQATIDADEVISYSIDQTTAALTKLQAGGTSRTGGEPVFIGAFVAPGNSTPYTFSPKFAYVPNVADNTVSSYSSDPATGKLSAVGTPFPSGVAPQEVAVSSQGDVAFVASAGPTPMTTAGTVSAYAINAATGALSGIGGSLPTGKGPSSLAADRTGRFLYVANAFDATISGYAVDLVSGALTVNGAPTPVSFDPIGVVVDPTGRNLYALGVDRVAVYELDAKSGAITLSQVSFPNFVPSPILLPASGASQITVDPSGNFAYIPIFSAKMVAVFQIDPYSGVLYNLQTITTGRANTSIAIDPTGRFAYTADLADNTVSAYSVNQTTGALTLIGSPLPVGANALAITADFSGKFVYVVLTNKSVLTFAIGSTGALTAVTGGSVATGNSPGPITAVGGVQ
jgi:6-phosphogluconolactonase (cycloisomerase 2 family)